MIVFCLFFAACANPAGNDGGGDPTPSPGPVGGGGGDPGSGDPGPTPPAAPYIVTFHRDDSGPVPEPQSVAPGDTVDEPGLITREFILPPEAAMGLYLDALVWYTGAGTKYDFTAPVTGDLDLYAQWPGPSAVDFSGQSDDHVLAQALAYIAGQTLAETTFYTILLDDAAENYTLPGITSDSTGNINTPNAVITLAAKGPTEISLSSNGYLFYISAGKLILDNHITLKGRASNNRSLARVDGASVSLIMKAGAKITGNSASVGGGVVVYGGGRFIMEGGEIFGNSASAGGGVCAWSGNFTMEGGKITGNSISGYGGGVYVSNYGNFTMEDGEITGNSASRGGGVAVQSGGSFGKTGGIIYGDMDNTHTQGSTENTATSGNTYGHAVHYQLATGTLTLNYYYRDTILGEEDDIRTGTVPPTAKGSYDETNWIKKP
jgi:hypothetical protein